MKVSPLPTLEPHLIWAGPETEHWFIYESMVLWVNWGASLVKIILGALY